MDFANAIAIRLAHPFVRTLLDRDVRTFNLLVTLPFIGIRHGLRLGELCDLLLYRFAIRAFDHP